MEGSRRVCCRSGGLRDAVVLEVKLKVSLITATLKDSQGRLNNFNSSMSEGRVFFFFFLSVTTAVT